MRDHPDIEAALRTGYPRGYQEPPAYICPICEREVEDHLYRDRYGDIVGCDTCIRKVYIYS